MKEEEKLRSKVVETLNSGGLVIFPTDTAFGIGCVINNPKSVKKLFEVRRRSLTQAVPVLVGSIEMAKKYLLPLPCEVEKLMEDHWPGALTIIFPCKKELVPGLVRGGGENLGVRMPNNSFMLEVIKQVGVPILGPSANFHGEATPYLDSHLNPELVELVDLVIPGFAPDNMASTVIDCSVTPWKIVREGKVKINI